MARRRNRARKGFPEVRVRYGGKPAHVRYSPAFVVIYRDQFGSPIAFSTGDAVLESFLSKRTRFEVAG